jgi:hypothetical protein
LHRMQRLAKGTAQYKRAIDWQDWFDWTRWYAISCIPPFTVPVSCLLVGIGNSKLGILDVRFTVGGLHAEHGWS